MSARRKVVFDSKNISRISFNYLKISKSIKMGKKGLCGIQVLMQQNTHFLAE